MPFYVLLADGGLIFQTAFCRIGSVRFGTVVASMGLVGEVCLCAALYKLFVEERPSESKVSLSDGLFISFCLIKRNIGATVRVRYRLRFWRVRDRRVG